MNREKPRLCLVFAMGMEMGPFLDRVQPVRRWSHGKAAYREVFFEGVRLLVVRSGIGPQRAASALGHLGPRPDLVLSVGTAGALIEDLRVGDLVIASETVASYESDGPLVSDSALVDLLARACAKEGKSFVALQREAGIQRRSSGEIAGLGGQISRSARRNDEGGTSLAYQHQRVGIPRVEGYVGGHSPPAHPSEGGQWQSLASGPRGKGQADSVFFINPARFKEEDYRPLADRNMRHIPGEPGRNFCIDRMVTARDAVFSPEERTRLCEATRAAAVDMETYALASVAANLGIPCACLRVISDDFRSPRMPLRRSPRISWNRPLAIPWDLLAKFRWSRFLNKFERSIAILPPVLVRFIRELKLEG